MIKKLFNPFEDSGSLKLLFAVQAVILFAIWCMHPAALLPTPLEILRAWDDLARNDGMLLELWTSTKTIWTAITLSALIAFGIGYLSTADIFKPISYWLTAFRFLGFAGITFLFTLMTSSGGELKIWLLTFGMTVFLLTNMLSTIAAVKQEEIDYGRTLRLSPWRITYEIIVRGRLDEALDLVRQNAAIGWTMLSMVEGIVRSEGGIGALLLNQNKHLHLAAVFAIQLTILVYGVAQDIALRLIRNAICPYVKLSTVK